jgi:hypothetical protein
MIVNAPQELAYGLNNKLKLELTARPWNMHNPADTLWWLVPSTEWPAYSHGKLAFSLAKDDTRKYLLGLNDRLLELDTIFAGFNVEKGYGNVASFVNPALKRKPQQIIDPNWTWFDLIDGPRVAEFGRAIASATSHADIYVYVVSSYAHDRDADVLVQHDALMFKANGTHLNAVLDKCPLRVLHDAKAASDFTALAERLRAIGDYYWVDLYVGTHVPKGEVDLSGLYTNVLSCFNPWLK